MSEEFKTQYISKINGITLYDFSLKKNLMKMFDFDYSIKNSYLFSLDSIGKSQTMYQTVYPIKYLRFQLVFDPLLRQKIKLRMVFQNFLSKWDKTLTIDVVGDGRTREI